MSNKPSVVLRWLCVEWRSGLVAIGASTWWWAKYSASTVALRWLIIDEFQRSPTKTRWSKRCACFASGFVSRDSGRDGCDWAPTNYPRQGRRTSKTDLFLLERTHVLQNEFCSDIFGSISGTPKDNLHDRNCMLETSAKFDALRPNIHALSINRHLVWVCDPSRLCLVALFLTDFFLCCSKNNCVNRINRITAWKYRLNWA